ncbi:MULTISPECIES: NB-ARC domain-containing protein [unclassified Saccharopolyspora]|uniref:NB-ARC domain-containing protein n=1 Tax=unclassified Saccharopolyspora TaxID=2646250 RepID=UPI001CD7A9BD|nr:MULTISPECIES: NB-ARC domain-containing protein [unclassified Saccharopolyspora]MCA1187215.1 hypothetical protein [Saccharopolyspora sp. 6T]MCA1193704.1 hypothetical protein [Saccharopolyspora sp. 6V]MCA1282054.1 hypothetical protein [Saccharopolyspora sp. 7B]
MSEPVWSNNSNSAPVHGNVVQAGRVERLIVQSRDGAELPVPRTLPRDPRHHGFRNRVVELAELDRLRGLANDEQRPLTVVLPGMPGVGKTMTALRWAHQVQDEFSDGVLVADLGGASPTGPARPFDVLGAFLRDLGVTEVGALITERERVNLFHTLTAHRELLIVLDDAATSRQVKALLPPSPRSCVVVTTRYALDLLGDGGVEHVPVEPFDLDDALALVSEAAGTPETPLDPAALRKLAEACGRLPLALRVAGARLRGRSSIESFVDRVVEGSGLLTHLHFDGERLVHGVFEVCYRELPPAEARAYRFLGLHPGPEFSVAAVAALLGTSEFEAEEVLAELRRVGLLGVTGDRYRIHPLLQRHAEDAGRDADTVADQAAALTRLVEHYHSFAMARDVVLSSRRRLSTRYDSVSAAHTGPKARRKALDDLDTERLNLLAAVRVAESLGLHDRVWQLCESLFTYQFDRDLFGDLLDAHLAGIRAAEALGDAAVLARMVSQYGSGLFAAHDDAEARVQFERARRIAVECGDALAEQSATEWTGFVHERAGAPEAALECFERSRAIIRSRFAPEHRPRPLALYGLNAGRVLVSVGRYDEARPELLAAAEVFRTNGERGNLAKVELPLAELELRTGGADALPRLERVLAVFAELRMRSWQVTALELLAEALDGAGDAEKALLRRQEARDLAMVLGRQRAAAGSDQDS